MPSGIQPVIQVRLTNKQGLSTTIDQSVEVKEDITPPSKPALTINYNVPERSADALLHLHIGPSFDFESYISSVRYRIRRHQPGDSTLVFESELPLESSIDQFEGRSVYVPVPHMLSQTQFIVDADIVNGTGLSTRVSATMDRKIFSTTLNQSAISPNVSLFHFDGTSTINPNTLEITIQPRTTTPYRVDSIRYRVELTDEQLRPLSGGDSILIPSGWQTTRVDSSLLITPLRIYTPVIESEEPLVALATVEFMGPNRQRSDVMESIILSTQPDASPPSTPKIDAIYYGYYHPDRPHELDLLVHATKDQESRIASVAYRITEEDNQSRSSNGWTEIFTDNETGLFRSTRVSLSLPEYSESTNLILEVRSTNGNGNSSSSSIPISVVIDTSPPEIEGISHTLSISTDTHEDSYLLLYPGTLTDNESQISEASYKVLIHGDSTVTVADWTPIRFSSANFVRLPSQLVSLPTTNSFRTVEVELQAINDAGLESNTSHTFRVERDLSPPQLQSISATFNVKKADEGYLSIEPGTFRDPESGVSKVEYRIVDAVNDSLVFQPWTSIPIKNDIRLSVDAISIPRGLLPFDDARPVDIEFRTTNGAGLTNSRTARVDIPGDTTPPTSPTLVVNHHDAYNPRTPNTLEIQIGSSSDEESDITYTRYRVVYLSDRDSAQPWNDVPVTSEGLFPEKCYLSSYPLLSQIPKCGSTLR